jgi:parvulin-like peptidyl-prolyl isomerase
LGRQRLALVAFVAVFVALFVGFAIAQGIGHPSVPSGDVAIVQHVPDEIGTISEADFKRAMLQLAAQAKLPKLPKPAEKKYEELKTAALGELLDRIWIKGEAEELGISATSKQIDTELAQIKKTNFKTKAAYEEFLKTSRFTDQDVLDRVELQVLSTEVQEMITKGAPAPSSSEIEDYYEAAKDTQYTTGETRDARVIVNKDKSKVEQAKAALDKDDSTASWKKVAAKYSSDPTTKSKGGLQSGLSEELLESQPELKTAIFGNPAGEVVGPVEVTGNFFVIEVEKLNPTKVQTLDEVKTQIKSQLEQTKSQEFFDEFVADFQSKWQSRTFCASGYEIERCANYPAAKRVEKEREPYKSCYEADPKIAAKECPAPVAQTKPAVPGSITVLKPSGEPLLQRPRHAGEEKASPAAAAELPPGVTAPTGE